MKFDVYSLRWELTDAEVNAFHAAVERVAELQKLLDEKAARVKLAEVVLAEFICDLGIAAGHPGLNGVELLERVRALATAAHEKGADAKTVSDLRGDRDTVSRQFVQFVRSVAQAVGASGIEECIPGAILRRVEHAALASQEKAGLLACAALEGGGDMDGDDA